MRTNNLRQAHIFYSQLTEAVTVGSGTHALELRHLGTAVGGGALPNSRQKKPATMGGSVRSRNCYTVAGCQGNALGAGVFGAANAGILSRKVRLFLSFFLKYATPLIGSHTSRNQVR
jgi:hypothetical protein